MARNSPHNGGAIGLLKAMHPGWLAPTASAITFRGAIGALTRCEAAPYAAEWIRFQRAADIVKDRLPVRVL